MASIFPLFAIFWSFFWVVILRGFEALHQKLTPSSNTFGLRQLGRLIYSIAFLAYFFQEMFLTIKDQLNFHQGDKELYTLLHGRSSLLTDYSHFREHQREEGDTFPGFEDVSSVYTNHKYDSPVATWAHTPGEKITILYDAFQHPSFMAEKYFPPFASMMKEDPDLIIRYEPY